MSRASGAREERKAWTYLDEKIDASNAETVSARALAYQTYYLDRIELHLARIAEALHKGSEVNVLNEIQRIRVGLEKR